MNHNGRKTGMATRILIAFAIIGYGADQAYMSVRGRADKQVLGVAQTVKKEEQKKENAGKAAVKTETGKVEVAATEPKVGSPEWIQAVCEAVKKCSEKKVESAKKKVVRGKLKPAEPVVQACPAPEPVAKPEPEKPPYTPPVFNRVPDLSMELPEKLPERPRVIMDEDLRLPQEPVREVVEKKGCSIWKRIIPFYGSAKCGGVVAGISTGVASAAAGYFGTRGIMDAVRNGSKSGGSTPADPTPDPTPTDPTPTPEETTPAHPGVGTGGNRDL